MALVGSYGSGATINITMERLLWDAIKNKTRSERCEDRSPEWRVTPQVGIKINSNAAVDRP